MSPRGAVTLPVVEVGFVPLVRVNNRRLRAEMRARGLTWKQLSKESGVHTSALARALGDGHQVQRETFRKLREALLSHPVLPEDGLLLPDLAEAP